MKLHPFIGLIFILLINGCGKFNLVPEISINFQDPTDLTETSFRINWSINTADYQSLTFILADDPGFEKIVSSQTFKDNNTKGTKIELLRGAATYYYRISLVKTPGSIFVSKTKSIEMPYEQETISFQTSDSVLLKGSVSYRGALTGRRPAIIFMHEFGIFVNGWINSDILKYLVTEGYICLIYWSRGHGQSSWPGDIQDLIRDPVYLANDLRGALSFLQQNELVMADSIALMGASMGATMAVSGNGDEAVRTSVALSPANMNINYMYSGATLKSILYIVGSQDIVDTGEEVIYFPAQAVELYEMTLDPRELLVIENSGAHGTELLESNGVKEAILQWILEQMPIIP